MSYIGRVLCVLLLSTLQNAPLLRPSPAQGALGMGSVKEKINSTMEEECLLLAALLLSSSQGLFLIYFVDVMAAVAMLMCQCCPKVCSLGTLHLLIQWQLESDSVHGAQCGS